MSLIESLFHWVRYNMVTSFPVVLLLVFIFWYAVWPVLADPLWDIPGPTLARFTRLWMLKEYLGGHYERTNLSLHKKYGKIVRIAPNQYSVDDVTTARIIYGHGTKFTKSTWYEPWGIPHMANLFNDLDPKTHAALRRKVSSNYSMSSLMSYESLVDETTSTFTKRLFELATKKEPVNMGRWFQFYAFDAIAQITFSERIGFLDTGTDVMSAIAQIDGVNIYCAVIGVFPSLHRLLVKVSDALPFVQDPTYAINTWIQKKTLALEHAGKYKLQSEQSRSMDMVSKFLALRDKDPTGINSEVMSAVPGGNIFAGSDTTSISLSSILYHLLKHPNTMAKLRKELDEAAAAGTISNPITFNEAQKLQYLQAVIKEALRVHPATGFTMPRVVPPGGQMLMGRMVPHGTVLGVNSWVSNFNKEIFGLDANSFRPERWLEDSNLNSGREAYYFTFGQGSRTCIGKNISLLEISKAIPQLVRLFDFDLVNKRDWTCENRWFVKPVDFNCWVKRRETDI